MATDSTTEDRARSEWEVEKSTDFTNGIIRLLTSALGRDQSAFSQGELSTLKDIVVLLSRISSGVTGMPIGGASASSYMHGGIYAMSGGVTVTKADGSYVENIFGQGAVTTSVADQIAKRAEAARYAHTAIGTVDTFDGMSEQLVSGMYGKIMAERGFQQGDVHGVEIGTDLKSFDTQMRWLEDEGVTAKNDAYKDLDRARAARAKMDELAKRMYEKDDYNKLDVTEKAAVQRAMTEGVDQEGDEIDVGDYYGRQGRTYKKGDITETDVTVAADTAERGRSAVVVSDEALKDIDETAKNTAKTLQAWSEMLGTEDIGMLQATASRLRLQSVTSKKGTEQLANTMKDVRTYAELSGKTTEEVLQGYSSIAQSLDASGKTYSYAQLSQLYGKSEQFARDEASGVVSGPYTASVRMEKARQQQVNNMNNSMGIMALRHVVENNLGTQEQREQAAELLAQYNEAVKSGDIERARSINWNQARNLAEAAGVDMNDKDELDYLVKTYHTDDDLQNEELMAGKYFAKKLARGVRGVTDEQRTQLEAMFEEMPLMISSKEEAGKIAKAIESTAGMSMEEAEEAISADKSLTEDQKKFALANMHMFGETDEDRLRFSDTVNAAFSNKEFRNWAVQRTTGRQMEAEQQRRSIVEEKEARGEYKGDKGAIKAFTDALLHGETPTGEEAEKIMAKPRRLLTSDKEEDQISGLLRLKDREGNDFIAGNTDEERRARAKEMIQNNKEGFDAIIKDHYANQSEDKNFLERFWDWATGDDGEKKTEAAADKPKAAEGKKDEGKAEGQSLGKLESMMGALCTDVKTIITKLR